LTISRSPPVPVRRVKCNFGVLEEKSPLLSSIVVVCFSGPEPLNAPMTTTSVLAAVAATPLTEKQDRKASPPLPNSSVGPDGGDGGRADQRAEEDASFHALQTLSAPPPLRER
jgi:hypothetical protein